MSALSLLERISDITTIWAHEVHDFTQWLAAPDNLSKRAQARGAGIKLS